MAADLKTKGLSDAAYGAAVEWTRRVHAEYRSAALTAHLVHRLVQIGASSDLVREAMAVVDDELRHAEDAAKVAAQAASRCRHPIPAAAPLDREALKYPRQWDPLELDVADACVETFCLGETVAVPLFIQMRAGATVPIARDALDRIVVDEVRHRDFGWLLLETLLAGSEGRLVREFVAAELPGMCARLAASYARLKDDTQMAPAVRAWGLIPGAEYAQALARAANREYRPRLVALGFSGAALSGLDALEALAS